MFCHNHKSGLQFQQLWPSLLTFTTFQFPFPCLLRLPGYHYLGHPSFHPSLPHLLPSSPLPLPHTGAMGGDGMGMGGGGAGGGGSYGYYGNIPASTYGLLLGACRLGLEPMVYHTLQVKNMSKISGEQLQKAYSCSQENGHQNLANCLKHLVRFTSFVTR